MPCIDPNPGSRSLEASRLCHRPISCTTSISISSWWRWNGILPVSSTSLIEFARRVSPRMTWRIAMTMERWVVKFVHPGDAAWWISHRHKHKRRGVRVRVCPSYTVSLWWRSGRLWTTLAIHGIFIAWICMNPEFTRFGQLCLIWQVWYCTVNSGIFGHSKGATATFHA